MQAVARVLLGALLFGVGLSYADTLFTTGKKALAIPFALENGLVYLDVSVNGAPPVSFILDTGASYSVLSLQHARSVGLGLQPLGKVEGGSGDAPPDHYLLTDEVSFTLPGVVFSSRTARAMSLNMVQTCVDKVNESKTEPDGPSVRNAGKGPKRVMGGILGKDFFDSNVVEIDYAKRLINLYDPDSYNYRGKGRSLALEVDDFIFVHAQITVPHRRSVGARLMIDTGASAPLALTKEFFTANDLLPVAGKRRELNDCGIGGLAKEKSWIGKVKAISLGNVKLPDPITIFLQNPEAVEYDGILGATSLWTYKVIFDYRRHRMVLEPGA
jgi:hypothetical protein